MQPVKYNRRSGGLLLGLGFGRGGFPLQIGRATFSLLNFVVLSAHKSLYITDVFRLLK
jgi:hypothetical protein